MIGGMKRKWDADDETLRRKCIDEVIARVDEITDSGAGVIAAQDIIDIVTEHLGPEIYNKGIKDAQKVIQDKLQDIDIDLSALEQRA